MSTLFLCAACSTQEKTVWEKIPTIASRVNQDLVVCNLSAAKDTFTLSMNSLVSDYEIILLEESEDAIVKRDGHVSVSENYIGIHSSAGGGYKLFQKNGNFLRTVSKIGEGPNEYIISIYDSYIDESSNRIYLLPFMSKKILVFDLDGNPLQVIPLAYTAHKGRFKVDNVKNQITIAAMPFPDTPSVVWIQDFDGNIIQEAASNHLTIHHVDYSNEINTSFNTDAVDLSFFHWTPIADTLYHYDEMQNVVQPVFTSKFRGEVLQHDYIELPNHYIVRLNETPTSDPNQILVDKNTLKGFYAKLQLDIIGGINPPKWLQFNRGYFIANMYPYELLEQFELLKTQQNHEIDSVVAARIEKISNALNDDSNNIIILGKLRQEQIGSEILADSLHATVKIQIADNSKKSSVISEKEDEDRLYGWKDLGQFKNIPGVKNYKEYYRKNNRFKDWDINDKRTVRLRYIVEKNGKASNIEVLESSGIVKLDAEAVRLVQEAEFTIGLNMKNKPIRCGDQELIVSFPPL